MEFKKMLAETRDVWKSFEFTIFLLTGALVTAVLMYEVKYCGY